MELKDLPGSDAWIYLSTTGAGAGAQDLLWSVPGASAFLAGASFPYSAHELSKFMGYPPVQSVNEKVALDMALASYMRACVSCPPGRVPVGVGCTASVATLQDHRGAHRSWIAVISGHGRVLVDSQAYEKVGPKGRSADGVMVDFRIVSMIQRVLAGEGSYQNSDMWGLFSDRPLFRADGTRGVDAPPSATLMPGSFNPLHEGHLDVPEDVTFQLTLKAPHKPQVRVTEALKRAALINASGHDVLLDEDTWLYIAKARKWPNSTFYIGSDVLVQLLNPTWYETGDVQSVLEEFRRLGTKFVVSQRDGDPDVWETLKGVPAPEHFMFSKIPPGIHSGLSSTQIRENAKSCQPS